MNPKYVSNPDASAADDRAVEALLDTMPADDLFTLAAYAAEWDEENAEGQEEAHALVRPALPWHILLPVALFSLGVLFLAWGV